MLRHCTMAELLEMRDREGSAAARTHLDECAACRHELDRLHQRVASLKALPALRAPRDRWPAVRATIVAYRRRQWNRRVTLMAVAAAAAVAVAVGVPRIAQQGPAGDRPASAVSQVDLKSLVGESRRLEEVLSLVDRNGRVIDGLTASAIADLEDRIALIDVGIERATANRASTGEVATLWRQRLALMDVLVNVHIGQVAYEGF